MNHIDDLRDELAEHYLGDPPKNYYAYLDDAEQIHQDMRDMVERMTDDTVMEKCLKYKIIT